jgi:hypothetical protein
MELGATSKDSKVKDLEKRIDQFEEEITNPNNNYKPGQDNDRINPNITNNIAKTGEKAINGIFDFTFGWLESFMKK